MAARDADATTHGAPTAGRIAALDVMRAIRDGALADRALDRAARALDARERAWTHELVFGTLRLRARLDHIIGAHIRRPLDAVDDDLLDILRLGAYQLLEMHGVPSYAAVSQSVEMAKDTVGGRGAGGFVNGVLQSLRRNPDAAVFPSFEADAAGYLATWGSHPAWLVERWIARYGAAGARALTDANNERPELFIRTLTAEGESLLEAAGLGVERVADVPASLRVVNGAVSQVMAVAPVIVQDPAATLVAAYADDGAGRVIDLAAAPGGKALALAAADAPDRYVAAADLTWGRTARLRENVRRLQQDGPGGMRLDSAAVVVADARKPPFRPMPLVLLDAPCTGTGTLRRHPDGRWRLQPEDLASLARLQADLLDAAAQIVAAGGLLAYATCSLEPEENELQVESFLRRHPSFRLERGTRVDAKYTGADGMLYVLPHIHGIDGAFCALLRKD